MNRDEALANLRDVEAGLQILSGALEGEREDFYSNEIEKELAILTPAIAALSDCACGGKEPLAVAERWAYVGDDHIYLGAIGDIKVGRKLLPTVKEGDAIRILFLPAEEKP